VIEAIRKLLDGIISFFQGKGGATPDERRRLIRIRCQYQVKVDYNQQSFQAEVVDIGLNGMKLLVKEKFPAKAVLQVHQPEASEGLNTDQVECSVRWCRRSRLGGEGFEVGVQYADSKGNMRKSWVKFLLKELGFDERSIFTRRKAIRADSKLVCQLSGDDGRSLDGMCVNLGIGGSLFEGRTSYAPTSNVRLRIGPFKKLKAVELPGQIITTRRLGEDKDYQSSIRFGEMSGSQLRLLGEYVLYLLREQTPG
jgi:hypothetical protein